MKQLIVGLIVMFGFTFSVKAQHYNKNGTPDMRYKENKQIYGNSYSQPNYSQPNYSAPTYSQPTYSQPTYSTPSNNYPTYPQNKNGTPDMRYKENRQLYGNPYGR
jgi:hypothetical protein